ncbi:SURP and G-patch domain-containing protein 2 isoform X2 [Oenanthe melanoleuca]|uniref:SURP and G-patch domain-containing protein 2 isoform X2 n=1 Tax=Oenanthe melanoleuca TaxID=2939378 RepID=UPI0024C20696|nr:SURP and G-patch domain-containing protein 2 isoform X2 [Oenanthe melanoleuca]
MASRRITRETFEAVVQDKVKRYRDAAGDSSMHRFKAPPRPLPRPRYDADGRFNCQQEEWSEDPRDDYPLEEYPGETYPGPSYRPGSPLIRKENYFHGQFSRPAPRQREFGREYGRPAPQNREFGRGAVPNREYQQQNREYQQQNREYGQQNREYGRDRDYGQDYCWEGSGQHEPEFGSSDVLGDFRSPGLMEEEFGTVENQEYEEEEEEEFGGPDAEFRLRRGNVGRGRVLRGKRLTRGVVKPKGFKGDLKSPPKKWNVKKAQPGLEGKALEQPLDVAERPSGQRPLQQHPKVPPSHPLAAQRPVLRLPKPAHVFRNLSFDLVDKSDIFSTFGIEIIKWAGFHAIKNDAEFSRLFGALFELETETCAKMLASFKCSLRPEHRDYCFFTIKSLQHAALKTPKVDNEFLNMLLDKGAVKTKNCFFEIIKPFDKYIMRLQDRLLKGVTPLLMACNAYELSIKTNGFGNPREMANAFETTVSLCRKSLALLGQTFALASVFRQEKILEAVGLQEMAPAPTAFPNFDDSTLFGREYIENLKAWLEKSGYPIQMKKAEAEPTEQLKAASPDSKGPQRADRKILDTIEQLVTNMVSGTLSAKDRNAQKNCPEYWFLSDEESLEYKYFRLRLAEAQRRSLAPGSLRALLCARRVASIKRRLCRRRSRAGAGLRAARARRVRRAHTATQTGLRQQERSARNLPGPGGVTRSLPGPGGVTTNLPGPGGVTTNLPGPGGVTTKLPGPVGVTTKLPGPVGVTTKLPGPGGVTTNLPGPGGVTTNLSGPEGVTTKLPGPVDVTTKLPGPGGVTTKLPGPVGVSTKLPGPGGVTTKLSGPGLGVTSTPGGVTSTGGVTSALPGPALDVTSTLPGPGLGLTSTPGDVTSTGGVATNLPGPGLDVTTNLPGPVDVTTNLPGPGDVTTNLSGPGLGLTSTPGSVATNLPGPGLDVTSSSAGVTSTGGVTTALPGPGPGVSSALPGPGPGVSSSQVPEAGEGKAEAEELLLPLGSQFPDVDAKTMETAEKLAKFVAQVGPEIEQFSIENSADNPDLWFLQDQTSPAFKFYRMKVYELCPSITFTPEPTKPSQGTPELSEEEEEEEDDDEEEEEEAELEPPQAAGEEDEDDVAAGRRVAQLEEDLLPRPAEEGAAGEGRLSSPNLSAQAPGAPFPRKRVSSKSLKVGMIPASKRICLIEEPKVHEPVRIAYDRPRGCPVTKKKKKAKDLEFPQKRLSPRNVGFQMLQRMGWQEGHGLGSRGRGIREPVHLGATSAGEGLGVAGEENQEDAFDIFRQRMIQMYRQKRANK